MKRFGVVGLMVGVALGAFSGTPARAADELLVTEPNHIIGYLPLYVAKYHGDFAAEGIDVKWVTIENGSGPTSALLAGQAFAALGGPEHDAFAKVKGGELRAICNVVNRGNVYMVALKAKAPPKDKAIDWTAYLKGKTITTQPYSATPNSITRYLLAQWKLKPDSDVTLMETSTAASLAAMKLGKADLAVLAEPNITQGIRAGIWDEPIYNVPKELGPYAYSAVNVRADMIGKNPQLLTRFVRAVIKGLQETYANPKDAARIAQKEFPTMSIDDLNATLNRAIADQLWSKDGMIEPAAWKTAEAVVTQAGLLKTDIAYDQIFDMQFVKAAQAAK